MTQDLIDRSGKQHAMTARTLVVLIAVLVAALAVAAVVVSIGIARAHTADAIAAIAVWA